jgi:hypothetical protein
MEKWPYWRDEYHNNGNGLAENVSAKTGTRKGKSVMRIGF